MANVEVLESGGGTVGHSAAQLVGPVPHNLGEETRRKETLQVCPGSSAVLQIATSERRSLIQRPRRPVTATHLREVSHHAPVDRSHAVAPVLHLVVPRLGGDAPGPLGAGHVQVLPAAAGCREQEIERLKKGWKEGRKEGEKMPQSSSRQCEHRA